jgi:hypothetical protein
MKIKLSVAKVTYIDTVLEVEKQTVISTWACFVDCDICDKPIEDDLSIAFLIKGDLYPKYAHRVCFERCLEG